MNPEDFKRRTDITSASFSPKYYLAEVHAKTSFEDLMRELSQLRKANRDKTTQLKALVMDNFDQFISCREVIRAVSTAIGDHTAQSTNVNQAKQELVDQIQQQLKPMLDRATEQRQIQTALSVLRRLKPVFALPSNMKKHVAARDYEKVVEDYKCVLWHIEHVNVAILDRVLTAAKQMAKQACDDLAAEFQDLEKPMEEQEHAIQILERLGMIASPLELCLLEQHRHLTESLTLLQSKGESNDPLESIHFLCTLLERYQVKLWQLAIRHSSASVQPFLELLRKALGNCRLTLHLDPGTPGPAPKYPVLIEHVRLLSECSSLYDGLSKEEIQPHADLSQLSLSVQENIDQCIQDSLSLWIRQNIDSKVSELVSIAESHSVQQFEAWFLNPFFRRLEEFAKYLPSHVLDRQRRTKLLDEPLETFVVEYFEHFQSAIITQYPDPATTTLLSYFTCVYLSRQVNWYLAHCPLVNEIRSTETELTEFHEFKDLCSIQRELSEQYISSKITSLEMILNDGIFQNISVSRPLADSENAEKARAVPNIRQYILSITNFFIQIRTAMEDIPDIPTDIINSYIKQAFRQLLARLIQDLHQQSKAVLLKIEKLQFVMELLYLRNAFKEFLHQHDLNQKLSQVIEELNTNLSESTDMNSSSPEVQASLEYLNKQTKLSLLSLSFLTAQEL